MAGFGGLAVVFAPPPEDGSPAVLARATLVLEEGPLPGLEIDGFVVLRRREWEADLLKRVWVAVPSWRSWKEQWHHPRLDQLKAALLQAYLEWHRSSQSS